MSKLKWFISKPPRSTLVFTGAASLVIFAAASQGAEASKAFHSNKFAWGQGTSPAQPSTKPIVTVQSLPSTEPRGPSETRLEAPVTPGVASDIRQMEAPAAAALPSTPANNGPTPTEVAAYIVLAQAKIRQGDIASARRLLERASSGDEAEAWLVLAETYDPQMLARWGVLGIKPDPEKAKNLYQEAQRRGARGAREHLLSFR